MEQQRANRPLTCVTGFRSLLDCSAKGRILKSIFLILDIS